MSPLLCLLAGVQAMTQREHGLAYLETNAKDPEVTTLPSGLQYKVIEKGSGRTPTELSKCLVSYNGTRISGKRFESSLIAKHEKDQPGPKTFSMWDKELIVGIKEALALMKEGDVWHITIPSELAYGKRGSQSRGIQEDVVVIYEIHLIAVMQKGRFEYFGIDFMDNQTHLSFAIIIFYMMMFYQTIGNPFSFAMEMQDATSYDNPCVFLEVQIGDDEEPAGRIEVELFTKLCPKATENFRCLCTGEKGVGKAGKPLHFKGSQFHKIIPGSVCHGGDITKGDGTGGESIYGEKYNNEFGWSGWLKHTQPYLVTMANTGKHTNNSQFIITTSRMPQYDGKNVVVGKVFKGEEIITAIEAVGSADGSVSKPVLIVNSGMVLRPKPPKPPKKDEEEEKKEAEAKAAEAVEDKKTN
jgi:cyclophilin family peptidyl-prolyl cis-trans isomerase